MPIFIAGTPGTTLTQKEQDCLGNCVERFLDTSLAILQRLQSSSH
jgi:hypothetical protein